MKKFIPLLLSLLITATAFAQTEPANYKAAISKFTRLFNADKPDSIYHMFGPQMTTALSLDNFKTTTIQLKGQLGKLLRNDFTGFEGGVAQYKSSFENAQLAMNMALNGQNQIIGLMFKPYTAPAENTPTPGAALDASLVESPYNLKTLAGNISGSLVMPKNATGKVPVVLIIAGSGPTDRNGVANGYLQLAEALGKQGIATIRYDKRGVGQSSKPGKEIDMRFTDYVNDAAGLLSQMSEDQRFSKIIILGHSEGSLVGMLAAADMKVNGFISLAGPAESIDKKLLEQYKTISPIAHDALKPILDSLRKGKTVDKVDPSIYSIARPSLQPYLHSWMKYDPQKEIKKLKLPILIVQGTTDIQVSVEDAQKLKKAKSDATLALIEGMNHVLKAAPLDRQQNLATYSNPALPLKPELVTAVAAFVNRIK